MRAVVQRVSEASVTVDDAVTGEIGRGILVFLGVAAADTEEDLEYLLKKIPKLRIFPDSQGKMNLSVQDAGGEVLVVSQFTLCADTSQGNRPSFFSAADPAKGEKYYELFLERMKNTGLKVAAGRFGADMKVRLLNDGPVTILFDTKEPK